MGLDLQIIAFCFYYILQSNTTFLELWLYNMFCPLSTRDTNAAVAAELHISHFHTTINII